jgi:ADP-heptose:LPS heptosyltransferase
MVCQNDRKNVSKVTPSDRILVIKLGALGDVILSMPHIRQIVAAHPDADITLLTAPEYADIVAGEPGLAVTAFRRRGLVEMSRLLAWLRRQRFGTVYDLQGSLRSRIMTRVSGGRRRIGRRADAAYTHAPAAAGKTLHAFDELNRLLECAGIEPAVPRLDFEAGAPAREMADGWLLAHGIEGARLVLVHAGSSERWLSKRWDEKHYLDLAQLLEARHCRVLWIGAAADRELNRRLSSVAGLDATGAFDFRQLVALGQQAAFAVVSDSGPMHILAAAGLPVYAFFGPTDWRRSHAPGQKGRVLTNPVPCSPCYLSVCPPQNRHRCLDAISAADVIARLEHDGLL